MKSINLPHGHEIHQRVAQLVPWKLTRVQIAATPASRRLPRDITYTHRGCALLYNDGSMTLEAENLSTVEFSKQRFGKPVAAGIFWHGEAEEEIHQEEVTDPTLPVPGLKTDVTFPGAPATIKKEVMTSIARPHINAGHPTATEMKRLLVMHGAINAGTLTALEHLVCGTCERSQKPDAPRPASIPNFIGQFGERIQCDAVWIRDLQGHNHPILGIVRMSTNLQQAIRMVSRSPSNALDGLIHAWLRPYGYPLSMEVDIDGSFASEFKWHIEAAGVHLAYVPAEAHWRLGAIERRNSVLRTATEKLIDDNGEANGA